MKTKAWFYLVLLLSSLMGGLPAIEMPSIGLIPISVSVTGDVQYPGVYTLTTLNRLSDAVLAADRKALGTSNSLAQAVPGKNIENQLISPQRADTSETVVFNQRNIILIRQGNKQTLDLLKFYRTGDISQNPLLRDGDVLVIQPVHETVSLEGKVLRAGDYEFRQGDTLGDLLELALGFKADADLKHILLYRYQNDYLTFEKRTLDLSGYTQNPDVAAGEILQPGDRILVSENSEFRKAYKVTVTGKVKNAGTYYVNDNTTLYDLLTMCGGPAKEADLGSAYMYNQLKSEEFDPDFQRLKTLSMSQMTWVEYSFMRTRIRQLNGKYSIDIRTAWETQGKDANLILRDGDELVVPEVFNAIWVTGQVKYPGIVDFQSGLTWNEYIGLAGGFTNNRKFHGTRIIRAYSGNWVKPNDKIVMRPGDTIFVPEKEEVTIWMEVKEVILVASQVLTVILTLKTLNAF